MKNLASLSQCVALAQAIGANPFASADRAWAQDVGVVHGPGNEGPIKRGNAPGYDYQDQYIGAPRKLIADNMEPVVDHPEQRAEAEKKLAVLEERTGNKPNVIVFLPADQGASNRRSILYFRNIHFAAVRMDEFQYVMPAEDPFGPAPNGNHGGFSGTVSPTAVARCSTFTRIRRKPTRSGSATSLRRFLSARKSPRYSQVLKKYPPNNQISFFGQ